MNGENDEFDSDVLAHLSRAVHRKFSDIHDRMSVERGDSVEPRKIDRALQRLRKAGKVKFVARHGWIRVQAGS